MNWEKGKISVSIEEKDGSLIVSSVPAAGQTPGQPERTIENHFSAGV
ncbi:hypothetical protein CLOLEP_00604 [[Clostridium] leptum DSM 753]|uniref:Uncharacterized protein n=1 Tax=[Clostridium] leptum DSM 753 TaxID=428125 RepID=A7VPX7_9FIRM|nr:hypothetical protein CLOLEP_00604 [[Clostridium] leptum DSM 753]